MPTVAVVEGIKIRLYWDEHPPPHFHAEFAEYRVIIDIETLEVLEGAIPRVQYRKVVAWARTRQAALLEGWTACQADSHPGTIR
jgi:hypothetical protein